MCAGVAFRSVKALRVSPLADYVAALAASLFEREHRPFCRFITDDDAEVLMNVD